MPKVKEHGSKRTFKNASEDGYLKTLDQNLILESQKESEGDNAPSELQAVERIELSDYPVSRLDEDAILSCVRLRICNLSGCYIQNIGAFYGSVNLLKLNLSDNQVSSDGVTFQPACKISRPN